MAKKISNKQKKAATRVKLLKVEKVAPDTHHVHLEIEGAPDLPVASSETEKHEGFLEKWWNSITG